MTELDEHGRPEPPVAADAWPPTTQACLLADHFCGPTLDGLAFDASIKDSDRSAAKNLRLKESELPAVAQVLASNDSPPTLAAATQTTATYAPGVTRDLRSVHYQTEGQAPFHALHSDLDHSPVTRSAQDESNRLAIAMPASGPGPAMSPGEPDAQESKGLRLGTFS